MGSIITYSTIMFNFHDNQNIGSNGELPRHHKCINIEIYITPLHTLYMVNLYCISLVVMFNFQDILKLMVSNVALEVRLRAEIAEVEANLEGGFIIIIVTSVVTFAHIT